jgi:hypothetical protein
MCSNAPRSCPSRAGARCLNSGRVTKVQWVVLRVDTRWWRPRPSNSPLLDAHPGAGLRAWERRSTARSAHLRHCRRRLAQRRGLRLGRIPEATQHCAHHTRDTRHGCGRRSIQAPECPSVLLLNNKTEGLGRAVPPGPGACPPLHPHPPLMDEPQHLITNPTTSSRAHTFSDAQNQNVTAHHPHPLQTSRAHTCCVSIASRSVLVI